MKYLFIILFSLGIHLCYGQIKLKTVMETYNDSVKIKNYGIVGLLKTKKKTEKFCIGFSAANKSMNENNIFNIGSLTKTFTAVLILQEVEKGVLHLNDSLHMFFPKELCDNENIDLNITIEQLLRHRSGLGEVLIDTLVNNAFHNPFFDYNYSFLFNKVPKPTTIPGTKYKYSNTNYILLGYILELVNNLPYSEILRKRIFEPCRMKSSYAYYSSHIENAAHPIFEKEDLSEYGFFKYYQTFSFSAGGISSNVKDLSRFLTSLYDYKLFEKTTFEKMITFCDKNSGLGLEKYFINGNEYYGHSGANLSFKVKNFFDPKTGKILILLANDYNDEFLSRIANELLN